MSCFKTHMEWPLKAPIWFSPPWNGPEAKAMIKTNTNHICFYGANPRNTPPTYSDAGVQWQLIRNRDFCLYKSIHRRLNLMMGVVIRTLVSSRLTTVPPWDSSSLPWYGCLQTRAQVIHSVILPVLQDMCSQSFFAVSLWNFVVTFPWFRASTWKSLPLVRQGLYPSGRFGSFPVCAKFRLLLCDGN